MIFLLFYMLNIWINLSYSANFHLNTTNDNIIQSKTGSIQELSQSTERKLESKNESKVDTKDKVMDGVITTREEYNSGDFERNKETLSSKMSSSESLKGSSISKLGGNMTGIQFENINSKDEATESSNKEKQEKEKINISGNDFIQTPKSSKSELLELEEKSNGSPVKNIDANQLQLKNNEPLKNITNYPNDPLNNLQNRFEPIKDIVNKDNLSNHQPNDFIPKGDLNNGLTQDVNNMLPLTKPNIKNNNPPQKTTGPFQQESPVSKDQSTPKGYSDLNDSYFPEPSQQPVTHDNISETPNENLNNSFKNLNDMPQEENESPNEPKYNDKENVPIPTENIPDLSKRDLQKDLNKMIDSLILKSKMKKYAIPEEYYRFNSMQNIKDNRFKRFLMARKHRMKKVKDFHKNKKVSVKNNIKFGMITSPVDSKNSLENLLKDKMNKNNRKNNSSKNTCIGDDCPDDLTSGVVKRADSFFKYKKSNKSKDLEKAEMGKAIGDCEADGTCKGLESILEAGKSLADYKAGGNGGMKGGGLGDKQGFGDCEADGTCEGEGNGLGGGQGNCEAEGTCEGEGNGLGGGQGNCEADGTCEGEGNGLGGGQGNCEADGTCEGEGNGLGRGQGNCEADGTCEGEGNGLGGGQGNCEADGTCEGEGNGLGGGQGNCEADGTCEGEGDCIADGTCDGIGDCEGDPDCKGLLKATQDCISDPGKCPPMKDGGFPDHIPPHTKDKHDDCIGDPANCEGLKGNLPKMLGNCLDNPGLCPPIKGILPPLNDICDIVFHPNLMIPNDCNNSECIPNTPLLFDHIASILSGDTEDECKKMESNGFAHENAICIKKREDNFNRLLKFLFKTFNDCEGPQNLCTTFTYNDSCIFKKLFLNHEKNKNLLDCLEFTCESILEFLPDIIKTCFFPPPITFEEHSPPHNVNRHSLDCSDEECIRKEQHTDSKLNHHGKVFHILHGLPKKENNFGRYKYSFSYSRKKSNHVSYAFDKASFIENINRKFCEKITQDLLTVLKRCMFNLCEIVKHLLPDKLHIFHVKYHPSKHIHQFIPKTHNTPHPKDTHQHHNMNPKQIPLKKHDPPHSKNVHGAH